MVTTDDHELNLCVEVAIEDRSWIERLPPAPATYPVTVSFDDVELAARDRTAVTDLGYAVVGTAGVGHVTDVAHLLVPLRAVERHPRWWRTMLDLASRVYDLRFGPVQMALGDVLALHLPAPSSNGSSTSFTTPRDRARRRPNA
jgi:hypothetical protein